MDWLKIVVASLMRQIEKLNKKKADRADVERLKYELPEGLPEGYTAHQQLVTDSDGKTRWEDVPFGDYVELLEIVPPTTVYVGEAEGWDAGFRLGDLSDDCNFLFNDNGNGGKKYRVIWDGVSYDCVSYGDFAGNRSGIGNSKLFPEIASAGGKGEPFLFYFYYITSIRAKYPGTHTFAIYEMIDSVRTIDPKYLPAVQMIVTIRNPGTDSASCDKTSIEIAATVSAGTPVVGHIIEADDSGVEQMRIANFAGLWDNGTPETVGAFFYDMKLANGYNAWNSNLSVRVLTVTPEGAVSYTGGSSFAAQTE